MIMVIQKNKRIISLFLPFSAPFIKTPIFSSSNQTFFPRLKKKKALLGKLVYIDLHLNDLIFIMF